MCTLVCWVGQFNEAPLVVAANRDEALDRPSSPPMVWPTTPLIVAPRDDVSGGSWWAVNEHGLFVGLTNRAGATLDRSRRSRGALVLDIAAADSVADAERRLRAIPPGTYNGFHLLASDGRDAVRAIGTAEEVSVERVGTGCHILTKRGFGAALVSRDARVHELFGSMSKMPLDVLAIERSLAVHDLNPLTSVCVHWTLRNYGTRSSTVLVLGGAGQELWFAPGAPCQSRFEDLSALLPRRHG
jgi:uncharacterized protein with NRDE domain